MTIEQITDMAWEVVSEMEPSRSIDVFDVTGAQIIFQTEHGLKRICVACAEGDALKAQIRRQL
jgi:hypothetical protein